MLHAVLIFLLYSIIVFIYRRFFAKMISEEEWIAQLTAYNDEETYPLEERKKAEQFLIHHENLLRARGIRYITNEEFLARKNQPHIPAQKTTNDWQNWQVTSPSAMKIGRPNQTDNAGQPPPLPRKRASTIGPITIAQHGQNFGPYDAAGVVALWDQGQLAGNALYWHEQLPDWKPLASDIEALRMMLA